MARSRLLPVALFTITALSPALAPARPMAITVRNIPVRAPARMENGHVMLPLRVTFETLNSSVWYDARTRLITARNILHVLRLRVGSRVAMLDRRTVPLETPARLVNGSVYVPVAFAAEAMGAIIRYDPESNVLAVNGSPPNVHRSDVEAPSRPQNMLPAPNSVIETGSPIVSATLGNEIAASNAVSLVIDGSDVTANAAFDGRTIRYMPNELAAGHHTVAFTARTATGRTVSTQWSFTTAGSAQAAAPMYGGFSNGGWGGWPFAGGFPFPGGVVGGGVTIVGPPAGSGFGQICAATAVYPVLNRPFIPVSSCGGPFIGSMGNAGLFLTGSPLSPIGQYGSAPVFTPVFVPFPFHHFGNIHYRPR